MTHLLGTNKDLVHVDALIIKIRKTFKVCDMFEQTDSVHFGCAAATTETATQTRKTNINK